MTRRIAFWAALSAYALLAVLLTAGGATYPGYSHGADYISALGARTAPHGQIVNFAGFLPIGVGIMTFAVLAARLTPRSLLGLIGFAGLFCVGLSYAVAAFFPCDNDCRAVTSASQAVHSFTAIACYFAGVAGLFVLAFAARNWPRAKHLFPLGLVCGGVALVAIFASVSADAGLWQRVLEGAFAAWIISCALGLQRETPRP